MYKVIIIEDEVWPFTKECVEDIFGKNNMEIIIASSFKSALIRIWDFYKNRDFPDLAMIDVRLLKVEDFDVENIIYHPHNDPRSFLNQYNHDPEFMELHNSLLRHSDKKDGDIFVHGGLYLWSKLHSLAVKLGKKTYSVVYSASTTVHNQAAWLKELDVLTFMEKTLMGKIVKVQYINSELIINSKLKEIRSEIFKKIFDKPFDSEEEFLKRIKTEKLLIKNKEYSIYSLPKNYEDLAKEISLDKERYEIKKVYLETNKKTKKMSIKIATEERDIEHKEPLYFGVSVGNKKSKIDVSRLEEDKNILKEVFNSQVIPTKIGSGDFNFSLLRNIDQKSFNIGPLKGVALKKENDNAPWTFKTLFPTYFIDIEKSVAKGERNKAFAIFKQVKDKYFPPCFGRLINETFAEGEIYSAVHSFHYKHHDGRNGNSNETPELAETKRTHFFNEFSSDEYFQNKSLVKALRTFPLKGRSSNDRNKLEISKIDFHFQECVDEITTESFFEFLDYKGYGKQNRKLGKEIYEGKEHSIFLKVDEFKGFLSRLIDDINKSRENDVNKRVPNKKKIVGKRNSGQQSIQLFFLDDGQYILEEALIDNNSTVNYFREHKLFYEINYFICTRSLLKRAESRRTLHLFQVHVNNSEEITDLNQFEQFEKEWENIHMVEFYYGNPKRNEY